MAQIHMQDMEEIMVKLREGEVDQENTSLFHLMIYYERLLKRATWSISYYRFTIKYII